MSLFTEYSGIAVTPGESINYRIEIINNSSSIQRVSLQVIEQPEGWEANLTAGGWNINQLSVKPQSEESFNLQTEVPLQVEKGSYRFVIRATDSGVAATTLPISITVTEQGTFKTELETDQPNMQGNADSTFKYRLTLRNRTADDQLYALSAEAPRGWNVDIEVASQKVTSVKAEANTTQEINVTIKPPAEIEAGTYTIPVKAQAGSSAAVTPLEVNITGTYRIELSTPTGKLSTSITAGREKMVELQLSNTGSSELRDIKLSQSAPWIGKCALNRKSSNLCFPVNRQPQGPTLRRAVKPSPAIMSSTSKPGPRSVRQRGLRITVKTSALWGLIGVLIIAWSERVSITFSASMGGNNE